MAMQQIGNMSLKNNGGFVARVRFIYIDDNGEKTVTAATGDIDEGATKSINPGDLGVPSGSMVYMHADVVWGKAVDASRAFLYVSGNTSTAAYVISGTTLSNNLALEH